jgi:signal transduction histidine kinase
MRAAATVRDDETTDRREDLVGFARQILCRPAVEQGELGDLLAEFADRFGARRAGLAFLRDGSLLAISSGSAGEGEREPTAWPWEQEPGVLARAGREPRALSLERLEGGSWLVTACGPEESGWLLWLEAPGRPAWGEDESAALTLAAQALGRWLRAGQRPRWAEQLDRVARQQRLEDAAALAGRLAHDFGNVLTGILGFSELALGQQNAAKSPAHAFLTEVHRSAENAARYTRQLHLFARRQPPSGRSCPLGDVLGEEVARLEAAHSGEVRLYLRVADDLAPVAIDADQLRQVLGALLENAHEALLGPGSITISARAVELNETDGLDLFGNAGTGPHAEVVVADTGEGLSPEVQRHLFATPLYSSKPRHRGLGLATAYGILHAHRGGLRLYPGAEHGAVARVVIPFAPKPARPSSVEKGRDGVLAAPKSGRPS